MLTCAVIALYQSDKNYLVKNGYNIFIKMQPATVDLFPQLCKSFKN